MLKIMRFCFRFGVILTLTLLLTGCASMMGNYALVVDGKSRKIMAAQTYTVKKGDTLYSISKKYRVSVEDILKWNNKGDYYIKEGENLRIKEPKQP